MYFNFLFDLVSQSPESISQCVTESRYAALMGPVIRIDHGIDPIPITSAFDSAWCRAHERSLDCQWHSESLSGAATVFLARCNRYRPCIKICLQIG